MQEIEFVHIYVLLHVPEYLADVTRYFCRSRVYLSSVFRRENDRTVKFFLFLRKLVT